jgi:hypothetical protein
MREIAGNSGVKPRRIEGRGGIFVYTRKSELIDPDDK